MGDFVVTLGHQRYLFVACFGLEEFGIKPGTFGVFLMCVHPGGTVDLKVTDEFGIIGQLGAVSTGDKIAPVFKLRVKDVGMSGFTFSLMCFCKGEQGPVRQVCPLVFFISKVAGMAVVGWSASHDFLNPANAVETLVFKVGGYSLLNSLLLAVVVSGAKDIIAFGIAQRGGVNVVHTN